MTSLLRNLEHTPPATSELTLSWLGRTAAGNILQTPESLAAGNDAAIPHADVYYFRPHEVSDGPITTWIVPAELVLDALSRAE